jgi:hypothetical protein
VAEEAQTVAGVVDPVVENHQKGQPSSNKLPRLPYWQELLKRSEYGKSLEDGEEQRESAFLLQLLEPAALMPRQTVILTTRASVTSSKL